ncbi:MAG: hypothetical protein LBB93_04360 [Elusimicrobiota bacterium]|jgi:hypothetical protein|nr:hypothetical protein [Elusimicrobiota bacterium]
MNNKIMVCLLVLLSAVSAVSAQSIYEGKVISTINFKTTRIYPSIAKSNFYIKEGESFSEQKFEIAKRIMNMMDTFKTIDYKITENPDGTLTIDISAEDSYLVFPFVMFLGGATNSFGGILLETNFFRFGELAVASFVYSTLGYSSMVLFGMTGKMVNVGFQDMNYDEKAFANGSFSNPKNYSDSGNSKYAELYSYRVKEKASTIGFSFPVFHILNTSIGFSAKTVEYTIDDESTDKHLPEPNDDGAHNKAIFALSYTNRNMPTQDSIFRSIGTIFGVFKPMSVEERFYKFTKPRYGHRVSIKYEMGNSLTASDYNISAMMIETAFGLEMTNRNSFVLNFAYHDAFSSSFSDQIKSTSMLKQGRYARSYIGRQGVGASLVYMHHFFKGKRGYFSFSPFIEDVLIYDYNDSKRRNATGAGAGLSYTFWKFPVLLGLKYTNSLEDGSYDVSALFGAQF